MTENKKPEACYPCCVYALEADQIYRNFHTQGIKSYGRETTLEDGTVLHKNYPEGENISGSRKLVRCCRCGALFLDLYEAEYDFYDGVYSTNDWYPVASEEEADLLNILLDGKNGNLIHPVRRPYRSGWHYQWVGEGEYTPHDPEELRKKIWEYYYPDTDSVLLEKLIRKAGQEHAVENTPMPEPEEPEEEEEEYEYCANFELERPNLIRLGSAAKMIADMYVYPGVWKDTPHLNDIRYGMGNFMDYDTITEEEAMKLKAKLDEFYQQKAAEEKDEDDPAKKNTEIIIDDWNEFDIIENMRYPNGRDDD